MNLDYGLMHFDVDFGIKRAINMSFAQTEKQLRRVNCCASLLSNNGICKKNNKFLCPITTNKEINDTLNGTVGMRDK